MTSFKNENQVCAQVTADLSSKSTECDTLLKTLEEANSSHEKEVSSKDELLASLQNKVETLESSLKNVEDKLETSITNVSQILFTHKFLFLVIWNLHSTIIIEFLLLEAGEHTLQMSIILCKVLHAKFVLLKDSLKLEYTRTDLLITKC